MMTIKILIIIVIIVSYMVFLFKKSIINFIEKDSILTRWALLLVIGFTCAFCIVIMPMLLLFGNNVKYDIFKDNVLILIVSVYVFCVSMLDLRSILFKRVYVRLRELMLICFIIGFAIPIIIDVIFMAPIAYAGIPIYIEARSWGFMEWFEHIKMTLMSSIQTGLISSVIGFFVYFYNRLVCRIFLCRLTTG